MKTLEQLDGIVQGMIKLAMLAAIVLVVLWIITLPLRILVWIAFIPVRIKEGQAYRADRREIDRKVAKSADLCAELNRIKFGHK